MNFAIDHQHRPRLGRFVHGVRRMELIGRHYFELAVAQHKDAIRQQIEISASSSEVQRMDYRPVFNEQSDWLTISAEHARVHSEPGVFCLCRIGSLKSREASKRHTFPVR